MADLNELIDEIVQKKFVSLEAADVISAIKRLAESQRVQLAANDKKIKDLEDTNSELRRIASAQQSQLDVVSKREADVSVREKEMLKNELGAIHARDKAELAERLFNTVFRNPTIMRTMTGSTAVPTGTGYPQNMPVSRTDTETIA